MSYEIFRKELDASFDGHGGMMDIHAGYYLAIASSHKRGLLPENGKKRETMERDLHIVKKALKTEDDPT